MAIATTDPVVKEILDAFGLKNVTKFKLTMEMNSVVEVDVTYFPEKDALDKLPAILAKYALIPRADKEKGAVDLQKYVVDFVIDGINRNIHGLRNTIKDP